MAESRLRPDRAAAATRAAVADGLRRLAALPAEQRRAMGERGRDFVLAQHTYPVLARRFLGAQWPAEPTTMNRRRGERDRR